MTTFRHHQDTFHMTSGYQSNFLFQIIIMLNRNWHLKTHLIIVVGITVYTTPLLKVELAECVRRMTNLQVIVQLSPLRILLLYDLQGGRRVSHCHLITPPIVMIHLTWQGEQHSWCSLLSIIARLYQGCQLL